MPAQKIEPERVAEAVQRCREGGIVLPTFEQQRNPEKVPGWVLERLKKVGLWDVDPINLFRITWKNDPETGLFGKVNYLELPPELTGVKARIIGLVGKFFPTGAHKVGATFGCLVPRLVEGSFNPARHKAVWPSTGNYCRGGAYNCALLRCHSIAILPQEMSRERFEWLESIGSEVIATPGCESNVKEIYDKCWELKSSDPDVVVLNQFDEFGNGMWHYSVTAPAIKEVLDDVCGSRERIAAFVSATGSAGTIAAGDRLKEFYPWCKIVAAEALQCPTLLENGFGAHRIEGIGDKHVPWIHNVRNTDAVVAIDDRIPMALIRLFNEPEGRSYLTGRGVAEDIVRRLDLLGISSVANMVAAIKTARWFELDEKDVVFTVFTDSMEMYESRLAEARKAEGEYTRNRAELDYHRYLMELDVAHFMELDHRQRRRIHNLKYFTWIEQQKKDVEELRAQWYEYKTYWRERFDRADEYDRLIEQFNSLVRQDRDS